MKNNTNYLKTLNVLVILSIGILGTYWASVLFGSSDLGANDKDIISIFIAIAIAITVATIVCLLIYSTINLHKGIYQRQQQRVATILLIAFAVVSNLFVARFFAELSVISKSIFIYLNALVIVHAVYSLKKISE
jgi:hypothetical protein